MRTSYDLRRSTSNEITSCSYVTRRTSGKRHLVSYPCIINIRRLTHQPVTQQEMLLAHRKFVLYCPELTLDLESIVDPIDRSNRDYDRRYSESSGQGTSNEHSSDNNEIIQDLDNQFMQYDNPIVPPPAPLTLLMSDVNISGLLHTTSSHTIDDY